MHAYILLHGCSPLLPIPSDRGYQPLMRKRISGIGGSGIVPSGIIPGKQTVYLVLSER
jgi:hypothetical protein